MILGIGIDIVEIARIRKAVGADKFVQRVFTLDERSYCEQKGIHKIASYAARFAGKEAVMKAFGTGMTGGKLKDIEILPDSKGCPRVKLRGQFAQLGETIGLQDIHVSLTHVKEFAAAQVILWGGILDENCNGAGNARD